MTKVLHHLVVEVDYIEEEGFLLLPHMETPATFSVTSERRRCLKQYCVEYHVEGVEQCGDVKWVDLLYNEYAMK